MFEHNLFLWTIVLAVRALRVHSPHPAQDPISPPVASDMAARPVFSSPQTGSA